MEIDKHNIEQIALGDTRAFEVFYEQTYKALYRFVSYYISSIPDKEDVLSETYYNIWHNSSRVVQAKNIKAYIYSIAQYEVYKLLRQSKATETISINDMKIDPVSNAINSDDQLYEQQILVLLARAIDQLPNQCKLVYLLVREENLRYQEVADMLSITEGTVKQHMHQAIVRIKTYIKESL